MLWYSKTLKAQNSLTVEDNLVKPYTFSLHLSRAVILKMIVVLSRNVTKFRYYRPGVKDFLEDYS